MLPPKPNHRLGALKSLMDELDSREVEESQPKPPEPPPEDAPAPEADVSIEAHGELSPEDVEALKEIVAKLG